MNKQLLNAWAKPIFDFYRELAAIVKDTRFDMDMLDKAEDLVRRMPRGNPDPLDDALYEAMSQSMQQALLDQARLSRVKTLSIADDFGPVQSAIDKFDSKSPVLSAMSHAEWQAQPLAIRDRSFWSARVENEKLVQSMKALLQANISQKRIQLSNNKEAFVDRNVFIMLARQIALDEGLDTKEGNVVTNIASQRRLGLIFDFQTGSAQNYARWKIGNDPDFMDGFPACELSESRARHPRSNAFWASRWQESGQAVNWEGAHQTKFIALKNSPIWTALSRFGLPWPPFEFGSTRVLEQVSREETEKLGLLGPDDDVPPAPDRQFNDDMRQSVSDLDPNRRDALQAMMGDQVDIQGGGNDAVWVGSLVAGLVAEAAGGGPVTRSNIISFGSATNTAVDKAADVPKDLSLPGTRMVMDAQDVKALLKSDKPTDTKDIELIPHVWRRPDRIRIGDGNRSLRFDKSIIGRRASVNFEMDPKQRAWRVTGADIK